MKTADVTLASLGTNKQLQTCPIWALPVFEMHN